MKKWLLSDFVLVIVIVDGLYVTHNEQNWVSLQQHFSAVRQG
jgi:hypothetical protein